jgi:23S rRNA pseudouridine2605 synthase
VRRLQNIMTKHTKVDSPEKKSAKTTHPASAKQSRNTSSANAKSSDKRNASDKKSNAARGSSPRASDAGTPRTSDNFSKTKAGASSVARGSAMKLKTPATSVAAENSPVASNDEKLQKVLARAGLGSRRDMERAIESGSVKVNDHIAKLGDRVSVSDKIFFNGQRVVQSEGVSRRRVILYNKPEGEICSRSDPEGRRTVYDGLPQLKGERWISVGRLDFNTSGLLLFTNDGELANKLMHPSSVIDREYLVRIQGDVEEEMKQNLLKGVMLDDGVARFTDIVDGAGEGRNRWFYCVVMEGRNREVRRLWESQGVKVSRLKRVRYANIFIPSHVRVGQWLELGEREIADLCMTAGFDNGAHTKVMPPSRDEKMQLQRHENKLRSSTNSRRPPAPKRRKNPDAPAQ